MRVITCEAMAAGAGVRRLCVWIVVAASACSSPVDPSDELQILTDRASYEVTADDFALTVSYEFTNRQDVAFHLAECNQARPSLDHLADGEWTELRGVSCGPTNSAPVVLEPGQVLRETTVVPWKAQWPSGVYRLRMPGVAAKAGNVEIALPEELRVSNAFDVHVRE